ncbi:hypothetical protein PRIPAC_81465 [Pristionchus pacificus]|uniref:MSP domain-containing protein n=1 Tax=Pristionchus pacificus TaxID=54126 RepID=A0A2A6BHW4_PRIPA|nr:hypothetical protein PRIPAC_81465 [Pristionchus pacificus]|eukprot:PDM65482.1 MSP domain-containing protein [Pristionchus pacificus]
MQTILAAKIAANHVNFIRVSLIPHRADFLSSDTGTVWRRLTSNGETGVARHLASAFCANIRFLDFLRHSSMNSFGAARSLGTFSFHLILVQVLICGTLKLIVRCLSIIDLNSVLHLLQFELLFDFDYFMHYSASQSGFFHFSHLSGSFWDNAKESYSKTKHSRTNAIIHSNDAALAGKFPEFFYNPTPYDIAQTIRDITLRFYDILPITAFLIYTLIIWLLFQRRKQISSSQRAVDYKVLAQGCIILGVYGQFSPFMQTVLFFSISLDVITAALIPLSIMAVSSAMRAAPRQTLIKWRAERRQRSLARRATRAQCMPADAKQAASQEKQPSAEPVSSDKTADSFSSKPLKVIQPEWANNPSLHFSYSLVTLTGERAREMKRRILHPDSPNQNTHPSMQPAIQFPSIDSTSLDSTSLDVIVADAHEVIFDGAQEKQMRMMNVGKGKKMFKASINDKEFGVTPIEGFLEAGAIANLTIKNAADPVKRSLLKVKYCDASDVIDSRSSAFTVQLRPREKSDQGTLPNSIAVYPREICFSKNGKPGAEERKLVVVNFSGNRKAFMVHASRAIHEHTHNKATSGFVKPESFSVMTVLKAMAVTPNAYFEVGFVDANLIVASPAVAPTACELVLRSQNVEKKRVTVTWQ